MTLPGHLTLRGYRDTDQDLLTGRWLPGELLGLPLADWPALAEPTAVAPPTGPDEELCVLPGAGFVRYTELDWVHRRARVEIGVSAAEGAAPLVAAAVAYGLGGLGMHRLHGWVTPATSPPTGVLAAAGFRAEARISGGTWLAGRPTDREIWGVVRDD